MIKTRKSFGRRLYDTGLSGLALRLESALLAIHISLRLRFFSFDHVLSMDDLLLNNPIHLAFSPASARDLQSTQKIAQAVRSLGIHAPLARHCLVQALVAKAMLQRRGQGSTIRIGVQQTSNGALRAHAWLVDLEGSIIIGERSGFTEKTTLRPIERL